MGCMPVPLPELYELCEKLDLTNASLEGSSTTTWEISTSRMHHNAKGEGPQAGSCVNNMLSFA